MMDGEWSWFNSIILDPNDEIVGSCRHHIDAAKIVTAANLGLEAERLRLQRDRLLEICRKSHRHMVDVNYEFSVAVLADLIACVEANL